MQCLRAKGVVRRTAEDSLHLCLLTPIVTLGVIKLLWPSIWSMHQEDSLEEEVANHSSMLAWEISWTEKPGRIESMGSQRVRCDLVTKHTHTHTHKHICVSMVAQSMETPQFCHLNYHLQKTILVCLHGSYQKHSWPLIKNNETLFSVILLSLQFFWTSLMKLIHLLY